MDRCLERARAGDRFAVESLARALRPRLARMAAYYARCSGEDAEDLLQEAWLGLLEALPDLDLRIGDPRQHLIRRARWRLLDAIRRARRRRCDAAAEELLESLPDPAGAPMPERVVERASMRQFARGLKQTQRQVLACLMAGLTWRETGRALGCTSANVAYHVRQIRRQYETWAAG